MIINVSQNALWTKKKIKALVCCHVRHNRHQKPQEPRWYKLGSDEFLVFVLGLIPLAAFLKWDFLRELSATENDLRTYFHISLKDDAYLVHCQCLANSLGIMSTLGFGSGQSASASTRKLLEVQVLGSYPRPTESRTVWLGPSYQWFHAESRWLWRSQSMRTAAPGH